jgi:hypothetical protein
MRATGSRKDFDVLASPFAFRALGALTIGAVAISLAACGGSASGPATPTVAAARTYELSGFRPAGVARAGRPTLLSFTIAQPSGKPLTAYRRGAGPHVGVHVIVVRDDLSTIIHQHPPVSSDGTISTHVTFPSAGRYRLVVDAYPASGAQPNFQLFRWITVGGAKKPPAPLGSPRSVVVDGYRFTLAGGRNLKAIEPALLTVRVTGSDGKPAVFSPWYGALAHAIFFRAGSLDYFHTHVCSPGATGCTSLVGGAKVTGTSTTPGKLTVGVLVPVAGIWRLFLQTQVDGHVLTAPFTLKVA